MENTSKSFNFEVLKEIKIDSNVMNIVMNKPKKQFNFSDIKVPDCRDIGCQTVDEDDEEIKIADYNLMSYSDKRKSIYWKKLAKTQQKIIDNLREENDQITKHYNSLKDDHEELEQIYNEFVQFWQNKYGLPL